MEKDQETPSHVTEFNYGIEFIKCVWGGNIQGDNYVHAAWNSFVYGALTHACIQHNAANVAMIQSCANY